MIKVDEVFIPAKYQFGHLSNIIDYLVSSRKSEYKKFCSWNGVIYRTADIVCNDLNYPLMKQCDLTHT